MSNRIGINRDTENQHFGNEATKVLRAAKVDPATHADSDRNEPRGVAPALPRVPGYEVLAHLGQGSMGVVYKARQKGLDRLVALKMIRAEAHAGMEELQRFMTEARVVASLQHPNIVLVYDVGLHSETPYFSMELVEGGSLADRLQGRPQSARESAQLIASVARAMHSCHESGIVHRDLKPGNILLAAPKRPKSVPEMALDMLESEGGELNRLVPKITDFGLAKQLHDDAGQTESGMIMGTPSYMAPEQAEGKSRDVGPAADIYALGAILYEMLTGRPPFLAESSMETVLLLFHSEPVPPSRLQPKVPRDLETICLKCLHKSPKRRYASAHDLAEDLHRYLRGDTIHARPASVWEKAWNWTRRHPSLGTLAACTALAVVAAIGFVLFHHFRLHAELDQALRKERQTRDAEQASVEHAHLADLRAKVGTLLHKGESALAVRDWPRAHLELIRARDALGRRTELGDLRARIDRMLEQTTRFQRDHERLQTFRSRADDALFHATFFTGSDFETTWADARMATLAALDVFGLAQDSDTRIPLQSPLYTDEQHREIRETCFELLVLLAESTWHDATTRSQAAQARMALAHLDRAASLGIDGRALALRRAYYLDRVGDSVAADQARRAAAALTPTTAFDHFMLGRDHFHQGLFKDASANFENALQIRPEHFWSNYYLALCNLKLQRPDHAAAFLTTCLSQRRDFAGLHVLRGAAWSELAQYARGEEDFAAALKTPLPENTRYGLLVNRGVMRLRSGQTEWALSDLGEAVRLRPDRYQGYVNLAQAFVTLHREADALGALDQAIALEPGMAALYRTRARLHGLREAWAKSQADWERVLRLDEDAPASRRSEDHFEHGRILHKQRKFSEALASYDRALGLPSRQSAVQRARAEVLLELDRPREALQALDACLGTSSPDAGLYQARAALRMRLGYYAGALTDYTRVIEREPTATAYAARGWCHLVADAPKFALPDFAEALRLAPDLGEAYVGRGYAMVLLGEYRLALADAEEGLRRSPDSTRLRYNAARIYAQALARATAEERPSRSMLHDCQQRALSLLSQSLQAQPTAEAARFWSQVVQMDKALYPLRNTPEYRRLAERLVAAHAAQGIAPVRRGPDTPSQRSVNP